MVRRPRVVQALCQFEKAALLYDTVLRRNSIDRRRLHTVGCSINSAEKANTEIMESVRHLSAELCQVKQKLICVVYIQQYRHVLRLASTLVCRARGADRAVCMVRSTKVLLLENRKRMYALCSPLEIDGEKGSCIQTSEI